MSNQIRVLYTEQKTKKVKLWLDGYLVPRATLNSARLISAGKHEIDVVFYSSIDDIKPGREFETDRYLISIEESHDDNQPCPRPSFAVNDPTMRNKPKSAPEPPPAPTPTFERHNPNQWGYAGMTTAMKRYADDSDGDNNSSHLSKISKSSHFIPPTFHQRQTVQNEKSQEPSMPPSSSLPTQTTQQQHHQQPGLFNDALISRLLNNNARAHEIKSSPVKQSPKISWSTWDDKKSDDDDDDDDDDDKHSNPKPIHQDENSFQQPIPTKQTFNWHTLVKSAGQYRAIDNETKTSETMPKFDFDESSFDTLFDNLDE